MLQYLKMYLNEQLYSHVEHDINERFFEHVKILNLLQQSMRTFDNQYLIYEIY